MNKKEIIIIGLLLCLIFLLPAVGAADASSNNTHVIKATNDVESTNVSAYSLPDSDIKLQAGNDNAGTFSELRTDIENGGSNIILTRNYTYDSSSDSVLATGIPIPNTVTKIDGQGKVIIDGSNLARAFFVQPGSTITLTGITFINCNATKMPTGTTLAGHGGSIFAKGVVNIDNCRFIDNTATNANGGALFLCGEGSTITNSYFEGNTAIKNPNNMQTGGAGALFLNASNVEISHSTFIKNAAGLNGGAIGSSGLEYYQLHDVTITNCTLSNNTANGSAGAIGMQSSNFHITDSTLKYNEAKGMFTTYPGNGGALVMRGWDSYAYNCTFISNIAELHGGAAYSTNTSYNPLNNNTGFVLCTFINNTAGHNGGAVDWAAGATHGYVEDCTFTKNTAKRSGGALHWSGHYGIVANSTFTNNNATGEIHDSIGGFIGGGDGGAIVWVGSHGLIKDNCNFTSNYAASRGGAIYMHGNDTEDCTNITVANSKFDSNYAGINGGAVDWNEGSHDGNILYSTFINNVARSNGGAVFWSGHNGEILYSNFTNNTAKGLITDNHGNIGDGGAIIWTGLNGTVMNTRFINNSAAMRGGAVYLQNCSHGNCSNTTFDHVYFKNNTAGTNGGAIDWHEGAEDGHLLNAVFEQNTAKRSGGAIYWNGKNGEIKNSNFTNNKALGIAEAKDAFGVLTKGGDGGAVIWIGSEGKVDNCIFEDNEAAKRGGAVYLQANGRENCTNTNFTNSKFINNTAGTNGGAIDWNKGAHDGLVENVEFINNTAKRSGGAVYWNGEWGEINHANFTGNRALGINNASDAFNVVTYGGDGGAVIWIGPHGSVDDCRFENNSAAKRGGAVYLQGTIDANCTDTNFTNSKFINNTAGTNGGAIDWNKGAHDGLVDNVTFIANIAKRSGGAVYWNGNTGQIKNSNFTANRALGINNASDAFGVVTYGGDGGAVIWIGSQGTVDNCRFIDNDAAKRGGAVYLQGTADANCTGTTFKNSYFRNNTAGTNGGAIDWNKGAHDGLVDNVTFIANIAKRSGGAVYWNGNTGQIKNSNFTANRALGINNASDAFGVVTYGGDGGAVIWIGSQGTVDNCRFIDNDAAKRGGAVYLQGTVEANCTDTNFTNSYFINNTAGTNGGAIDWNKGAHNGIVDNVTFINNTAKRSGGAIYWNGHNGTIQYSKFYNNTAKGITSATIPDGSVTYGGDGGAIIWSGALGSVIYSEFVNNTAAKRGGAVFLQGSEAEPCENTSFKHSYFAHNVAGTNGGAVDWYAGAHNGLVENVTFINNTAHRNGGAIFWHGDNGTVKDSTFRNNRATGTSWEYIWAITREDIISFNETHDDFLKITPTAADLEKLYVINETLSGNRDYFVSYVAVKNETSGEYYWEKLDETIISLSESIISPIDWATDQYFGGDGGTILWSGDIGLVYNCTFIGSDSARRGGGAYMTGSDNVTFDKCYFENSTSGTNGGGVDWLAGANWGKIYNTVFNNTRAARSAGAIYYDGDYGEMKNITIINTTSNGGSLKVSRDGRVHYAGWDSSHWDTNTTGGDAGAIMITGDHLYIYNATFINCTSVGRGGAVFLQDNKNATFELCVFENNYAKGIANNTWANYTLERDESNEDTQVNYKLTGHGGAVAFDVNAKDSTIIDSKFYNNLARRNGGAINFDQGSTNNTIKNSEFINNTVYDDGGAINFDQGSDLCSIYNSTFYNNTGLGRFGSTTKGGTICLTGSNITISDSKFILGVAYANTTEGANLSATDAGAIFVTGNYVNITNTEFDRCYSPNHAGAIKVIGNHTTIDNCTFENCNATKDGGAIYVNGLYCKVFDSKFINDVAGENGGAVYIEGDGVYMEGSTFNNTFAGGDSRSIFDTSLNVTKFQEGFVGKGGAIYVEGNNATILDSVVNSSYTTHAGGAIYVEGNNATISVDFINCRVGFPTAWITPDIKIFNPAIDDILAELNTVRAYRDTLSGVTNNLTTIYNSLNNINNNLVKKIFVNKVLNTTALHAAIDNLTELNDIIPTLIKEGSSLLETLNLTSIINNLKSIPDNATFNSYNNKVNSISSEISSKMNEINNVKNTYNTFSNNLNSLRTNLGYLKTDKTIKEFNNRIENQINVNLENIYASLDVVKDVYVDDIHFAQLSKNISDISNNVSYIKEIGLDIADLGVRGGAIYVEGNDTNITESNFENCFVSNVFTGEGGAIYITGTNTNIELSEFVQCYVSDNGGAIFVEGNQTTITNSIFKLCNSTEDGGAIYVEGFNCELSNSTFNINTAGDDGGAIYWNGNDGKIYNITCLINIGISLGSSSSNGGTLAITGSNITVDKSSFAMSSALISGGAIFITGDDVTVSRSSFDRCNVSSTATVQNKDYTTGGGAIYILGENANIEDCIFVRSHGKEGGVIYVQGKNATINNASTNSTYALNGGAIYIKGTDANILNSEIGYSYATVSGGAVYIDGYYASVKNSTFANNKAISSISSSTYVSSNLGGTIYIVGNYANILDSEFINSSAYFGGVIYLSGSYCNVTNSSFNSSFSSYDGGAIYSTGSYSNVYTSNFTNNYAKQDGGALFWYGGTSSTGNVVDGCIFINNTAYAPGGTVGSKTTRGGGAIYWSEGGSNGVVRNSQFINNSARTNAKVDGGAILWDKSKNSLIDNCTFDGNYITSPSTVDWMQGGAIYIRPSTNFVINNSVFKNGWSMREAGALYVDGADATGIYIVNTEFINNTAKGSKAEQDDQDRGGGAVMVKGTKNVWLINDTFINNTADYGGALTVWKLKANSVYVINSTFDGNKATGGEAGSNRGGSIYGMSAFTIENCKFLNSMADEYGGGVFLTDQPVTLKNLTFINNSATYAGGLYWMRAATIENMNFINNSADYGGAIYVTKSQTIKNNNFTGNTADMDGGAIYVSSQKVYIQYNNFTNNSAVNSGGAIYAPDSVSDVSITYSEFNGNHAYNGGAIYSASTVTTSNFPIAYCKFINNSAVNSGGAIYVATGATGNTQRFISNCYFDGNDATKGGAVYVYYDVNNVYIQDSTFENSLADNGGAIYYEGSSSPGLWFVNDTFRKNIAIYNGGAIYYVTNNRANIYRDFNNFDGIGIPVPTQRTDVYTNDTAAYIIQKSLFEDNLDYLLKLLTEPSYESPVITVEVVSPGNVTRNKINVVINLTNSTTGDLISQVIITPENYGDHYNRVKGVIYATFTGLITNQTYNITVGFSHNDYLYKVNSTHQQAYGDPIGDFTLLQRWIDGNITNNNYEIHLPRTMRFTPYDINNTGYALDTKCMNLTNITEPLTIYGDGWAIDARGFSRIFNITAANVTFVDVEFANGNASGQFGDGVDKGGALFWAGVNGTLINCGFSENNATVGGAIYYNSTALNAKIYNTSFVKNNAVTNGGAIDCNAPAMELINTTFENNTAYIGAALCREVNATGGRGFNNTFIDNHADYAGAALAWVNSSSIHIDTYFFYNNTAGYSGGAIYVGEGSGSCVIENCVFNNNYVTNETDGHGGAIEWYAEKGNVTNSIFTNNHAYDGGAIYVGSESGQINITRSTFKENHALSVGGAISLNASSVTINESNFYDNKALEGGALYVGGIGETNYVYNSVFEGNNATNGNGGAINWMASSGTLIGSNLTNNNAFYGGGIYFGGLSEESIISKCIFTDNHAKYNGGAIDCNASRMTLTNTIFDGNVAQFGAALCREINAQKGSGVNNTFKNNHAWVSGAALGWMSAIGISITNYTFINNSAEVSGGAIYINPDSHNCSIIDCNFEDNYVTNITSRGDSFPWKSWDGEDMTYRLQYIDKPEDAYLINTTQIYETETIFYYLLGHYPEDLGVGGAINILAENATINGTKFTGNHARLGGAIYVGADLGNTKINNDIFTANTADERGGAINLHASAVNVNTSKFYNNIAINGSALYVGGVGTDNTVYMSVFEGNNATGYGAGVYWIAHEGVIDKTNFTNNKATYGGGIFFNGRSANTNVTNSIFKLNNATKNGGAIECNASNIGIYNLTFDSNYAGEYGAALCREINATGGHGTNNTFIANHAEISGAGLAWLGVKNIHIVDYKFINNTARQSGAGIYIADGSDNAIIDYTIFIGNRILNDTSGHGGAIDVIGNNAKVINSNFTDNSAYYGGAIWFDDDSGFTNVTNATFKANRATTDGGAINLRGSGITIDDARFYDNIAGRNGGALYAGLTGDTSIIHNSIFENNVAGDHGGAIDWRSAAGEIVNSNFTANTAIYGGGIYLNGVSSNSRILQVIFTENRATKNGGAIDCNASMMGLNNTQFLSNYAGEYGAALCREANATGGFGGNNSFISNHADIAGAALAWLGVEGININNYTFINNTAYSMGGAIYVRGDSPDCKVRNSYFDNNYVTDVRNGQGGAIDWLGPNGLIANTTFENSFAVNGGTIYAGIESDNMTIFNSSFIASRAVGEGGSLILWSDNARITDSNFTYSIALERGGVIAAHHAHNTTIDNCYFYHSVGAGYVDPSLKYYGEGGVIFFENATNLNISNSKFEDIEAHSSGGSLYIVNCNDSVLYNVIFKGQLSVRNGGSISWSNSTNITIDTCSFYDSVASYFGGGIYLDNINDTVIKNSKFNNTSTPWGNAGAMYVSGNVTIENTTFANYRALNDNAGGVFFKTGNSSIIGSSFDGINAIWINRTANVHLTRNNVTGEGSNRDMMYLEDNRDEVALKTAYAVWNDGDLWLDKNNFTYVIFNNGTIWTKTTTKMLNNKSFEETWNETFTFFANITDDNLNTIISVSSLNTTNDVTQDVGSYYIMHYNKLDERCIYQGDFHLMPIDNNLKNNVVYNGNLKVKMPVNLKVSVDDSTKELITITARLTVPVASNYTISGQSVHFKLNNGEIIDADIICSGKGWIVAQANITQNHMHSGTYTVTATYDGDNVHWGNFNSTLLIVNLHPIWISIQANNIFYGQPITLNVASNATNTQNGYGYITIRINGKEVVAHVKLESDGSKVITLTYDDYKDIITATGEYTASVMFTNDTYYEYQLNFTTFNVLKFNTNISVNVTTPIYYGDNLLINVTVNETATGFVAVNINGKITTAYVHEGVAKFNITGLAPGIYRDVNVTYYPDTTLFNKNVTQITFTVLPREDYVFDVKVDNITYKENATVRVLLPTDADGEVSIYIDGVLNGTVPVEKGVALLENIAGLAGGEHVVNVTYTGDSRYASCDNNGTKFKVNPADWKVTLTEVDYKPYGEYTTINVTNIPSDLLGDKLTIKIDGIPYVVDINNGKATLRLNNLSAGSHNASVEYSGDLNYKELSQKFFPSIPQAVTTLIITRSNGDVIATIHENATGNITLYINGQKYENVTVAGVATFKDVLHIGFNYITAVYPGDKNFTDKFNVTTFEIVKTGTDLSVVASPESIIIGNNVVITVTMVNVTTGKVLIEINNYNYTVDINDGVATLEIALPVGHYTPKAYYLGDVEHAASNKTGNAFDVIDKITPQITITVPEDIKVGDNFNITVSSNGYNLTVWIDGVKQTIVNGNISYTVSSAGIHTVYANVTENATHYSANKTVVFEAVKNNATLIISDIGIVYVGDEITITVTPATDGDVTIKVDDVAITDGKFTPGLEGKYTITVESTETGRYYAGFNSTVFNVHKRVSQVNVTVTPTINVGDNATVSVKVPSNATGYVIVNVNGNNYTVNLTNGEGSVEIAGLKNETYKVTATYLGDDQYLSSINNTTVIKANKVASTINLTAARNGIIPNGTNMNITVKVPVDATGKVELTLLNGTKVVKTYIVYVNDGKGILHIYTPEVGLYNVTARYLGDDKYLPSENRTSFEVYSTGGKLTVTAQNVYVDTNGTVTVTILGNHEGEVTIIVRNATGELVRKNVTIESGDEVSRATLTLPLLEAGTYDVEAVFAEVNGTKTTYHEGSTSFAVSKIESQIKIVKIDNSTVGKDVIIYLEIDLDEHARFGNITILVNGHEYNTTVDNLEVHIPNLNATEYELEVTYYGNHWYDESSVHSHFTVEKNPISFVIEVPESKVGEIEHITVTLNESDATGIILLDVDGKHLYANVTSHVARFNIAGLKTGEHQINATYLGDYKYLANSTTAVLKITRTDTVATVGGTNITYGDDELIKFETAQNITSAVKVEIDGVNYTAFISEGKGNLTVRGLAAGKHNITLYVPQTEKYTAATAKANFTVSKGSADLSIEIANVTYGEVTTVNVYVNATGNVTFEVEGMDPVTVDIVNGVASLPLSGLGAGNYTVKATYNGNANVTTKEIESEFEVEKADPVITVEVKDIAYGDVEYIVITSNAPGNVTVNINGVTKGVELTLENGRTAVLMASRWSVPEYNGKADVEVKNLETGKYTVDVTYNGNENYNKATETAVFNVGKQNTTVDVEVEPSIKVGETQVINITVGNVNATGNVTINIDGVNYTAELANGRANFTTPKLSSGNHTVNVIYDGDKNLTGNWTSAIFEVSKHDSEVTFDVTLDGDDAIINVNAPSDVTRPVLVDVDGTGYYVNITDGKGQLVIPGISGGNHTVTARYLGDDKYGPSQKATNSFEVESVPSTVSVKVDNITYGDKAVVEVTVPTDATGNVTVTIGNKTYTVPVSGGKGVLVVPGLEAGNYSVNATYNGDDKYESSTNSTALEVSKVKVTPEDVKVIDQGNGTVVVVVPENATGNVTVKVGDKEYIATVVNGTAVITLDNSTPGSHEVEVIYSGDDNHDGVGVKANVTAPKRDAPIEIEVGEAKEGEPVEITVTVPEDAIGNVTISVDGKDYTAPIKDGKATFTVPELTDGDKTIAVGYGGDDNYVANSTVGNFTVEKAPIKPDVKVIDQGNGTVVVVVGDNATGNVTVKVDGKEYNATVVNGTAVVTIDNNVTPGTHEVEIVYSGDDTHNATSTTTNITGPKYVTPIEIDVGEAKEGEPVEISVTVPENATGDVVVCVGGKNYTAPVKDGKAVVSVDGLTPGDHTVAIEYIGDDNYAANYTIDNLTVEKAKETPDMKIIDSGNGTIAVVVGDNATGNVTVKVGDKEYTVPVENGTAIINLDDDVEPGEHDVEIIYSGDDTHDPASINTTVTGPMGDTPLDVTVENIKVGDSEVIVVNVPEKATGSITIEIDGEKYTSPIENGKATFTVDGLKEGKKSVFVKYDGDDKYKANTTTAQFNVDKVTTEVRATIEDIEVGDNLKVTVKLPDDATGQVLIDIDGVGYYVNITNGTGVAEIPRLGSGNYSVNVTYTGDDKYAGSSTTKSFNVEKLESFVIPTASNIMVGENENIKLIVPSDATGNVTVIIDGEEYNFNLDDGKLTAVEGAGKYTVAISGGNGELVISGLPKGEYYVSVRYNGDEKYLPATNTTIFTVSKIDTTMDVIDQGNGTVLVVLPSDATGNVTVKVGDDTYTVKVENGTAVIKLDETKPGVHKIDVSYSGDNNYASKNAESTVDIPKSDAPMTISSEDIEVGDDEVITITVPDKTTGEIKVDIDGKTYTATIKDGKAQITIPDLTAGNKTAVVTYAGDDYFKSNATAVKFEVSKVDPATKVTPKDITAGKDEVITVTLPSDATGQVLVEINGVGYYADVVNGKAKVIIPKLDAGKYTAKVTYVGDAKYEGFTDVVKFTVAKAKSSMSATADEVKVGEDSTITIDLPSDATGTVTVTIDGKKYTTEVVNGKAVIKVHGLSAGKYNAIVVYSGDAKYNSTTTMVEVVVDGNNNGTPDNGGKHEIALDVGEGVSLSDYPTGNPLWILLLVLLAFGSNEIRRRFRK